MPLALAAAKSITKEFPFKFPLRFVSRLHRLDVIVPENVSPDCFMLRAATVCSRVPSVIRDMAQLPVRGPGRDPQLINTDSARKSTVQRDFMTLESIDRGGSARKILMIEIMLSCPAFEAY